MRKYFTPPMVAKRLGVSAEKVKRFIGTGELIASNVSEATRPRWLIAEIELENFMQRRSNQATAKPKPQPRRTIPKPSKSYV
jgi:hypothetical protein